MQKTPGDFLIQQFNTLKAMFKDSLLLDSIEPNYANDFFTYTNLVKSGSERSPLSAKFFNSCKQYLTIFKYRSYHYLFADASIARFHYEFDKDYKLLSYNLHWLPCPFSSEFLSQFLNEDGQIEKMIFFEYFDNVEEKDNFIYSNFTFRTPIRIDFDANYKGTKVNFHPTSHIHFQDTDTRAKNNDIYCLYRFFAFIIENCYPNHYYKFYKEENLISSKMINESKYWLKCNEINDTELGENINTIFSF